MSSCAQNPTGRGLRRTLWPAMSSLQAPSYKSCLVAAAPRRARALPRIRRHRAGVTYHRSVGHGFRISRSSARETTASNATRDIRAPNARASTRRRAVTLTAVAPCDLPRFRGRDRATRARRVSELRAHQPLDTVDALGASDAGSDAFRRRGSLPRAQTRGGHPAHASRARSSALNSSVGRMKANAGFPSTRDRDSERQPAWRKARLRPRSFSRAPRRAQSYPRRRTSRR